MNRVEMKKKSHLGYLFPYAVMEPMFKKHFSRNLNQLIINNEIRVGDEADWPDLKKKLYAKKWIVYAKPPMGSVSQA